VSNDERPDSLAAQAAAWVPPWERPRAEPDRAYQAAHRATDGADGEDGDSRDGDSRDGDVRGADLRDGDGDSTAGEGSAVEASVRAEQVAVVEERAGELGDDAERELARERASTRAELDDRDGGSGRPDDDEDRSGAGLSDDDDDFDTAFEGDNPPGYGDSALPEPGAPGETVRAVVDEPRELTGEPDADPLDVRLGDEVPLPEPVEEAVEAGEDAGGAPVDAPLPPDGDDAGDVFDAAADDDVTDDGDVDLPFSEIVPTGDDDADFEADEAGSDFGAAAGTDDPAGVDGQGPGAVGAGLGDDDAVAGGQGPGAVGAGLGDDDAVAGGQGPGAVGAGPGDDDAAAGGRESDWPGGEAESGALGSGVDDEAAAYVAGAADVGAALAGGLAAGGDELALAEPTARPAAADGLGVPAQGRRRRGGVDASGGGVPRTPEADDAESDGAAEALADEMPALEDEAELAAALEAIMLVVDEPVAEMQLAQILEQPTERIAVALEDLSARYTAAGHGFDLRRAAGGWRFYTRPEYAAYVERFVLDGQSVRLTQAALETLAVVAYKQPVTRSRISAIRGVNCDGVMRTLATRGLIEECGTEGETGAHLYRTTALFLEKLGLNSVEQLPPLAPFLPDDVEEVLDATG
jgi:segregation and condensation protein B